MKEIREGGEEVHLDNCAIGDEGAEEVGRALEDSTRNCKKLYLVGNNIGDRGIMSIAKALRTNSTLTYLNLGMNKIGNEGAKEIATALKSNATLQTLSLARNSVAIEGATAIATALETNCTLSNLYLDNNVGSTILAQISTFLQPDHRKKRADEMARRKKEQERKKEQLSSFFDSLAILSNDELLLCIESVNMERSKAKTRARSELTEEAIANLEKIETTLSMLQEAKENKAFKSLKDLENDVSKERIEIESRVEIALRDSDYSALRTLRQERTAFERRQIAYENACKSYQNRKEKLNI